MNKLYEETIDMVLYKNNSNCTLYDIDTCIDKIHSYFNLVDQNKFIEQCVKCHMFIVIFTAFGRTAAH